MILGLGKDQSWLIPKHGPPHVIYRYVLTVNSPLVSAQSGDISSAAFCPLQPDISYLIYKFNDRGMLEALSILFLKSRGMILFPTKKSSEQLIEHT